MSLPKDQYITAGSEKQIDRSSEAGDVALGVLEDVRDSDGAVNDRRLLWKIDMRLIPLL